MSACVSMPVRLPTGRPDFRCCRSNRNYERGPHGSAGNSRVSDCECVCVCLRVYIANYAYKGTCSSIHISPVTREYNPHRTSPRRHAHAHAHRKPGGRCERALSRHLATRVQCSFRARTERSANIYFISRFRCFWQPATGEHVNNFLRIGCRCMCACACARAHVRGRRTCVRAGF